MPKSSIFCLIDVSGSMLGAYSRDFSNSKIESLTETLRNIVYSENLLGSEKDIYLFSLIFGTTKCNHWLNILEIFSLLKSGTFNFDENVDVDKIIYDKKYDCNDPERKISDLLSKKGAVDLDKYISKIEKNI